MKRLVPALLAAALFSLSAPSWAEEKTGITDAEAEAIVNEVDAENPPAEGDPTGQAPATEDDGNGPYRQALDKAKKSLTASYDGTPEEIDQIAVYILGNTINTLFHEFGHGLVSELELPIVAKEEDAVDNLANIIMVGKTTDPALDRMLRAVADDYFTNGKFSEDSGETATPWDEHSPDKARAYDVICILVGADPETYKETADRAGMPAERQEGCADEYESKLNAWDKLLSPYYLNDGETNTKKATVTYGKPSDDLAMVADMLKASGVVEVVTNEIAAMIRLPNDISVGVETCGESNAYWSPSERKLTLCYEIVQSYYDNVTENPPGAPKAGEQPAEEPADDSEPEETPAPQ